MTGKKDKNNKPAYNYMPKKLYVFYSPSDFIEVRAKNLRRAWFKAKQRAHDPENLVLEDVYHYNRE
jgi:hypothetical protein